MAYSPAGVLTTGTGLSHNLSFYLSRKALDNLVTKTLFMKPCRKFTLPKNQGKTLRMYRYDLLGTNTSENTAEGTVGTSLSNIKTHVVDAKVAQFDDFITVSDFHLATDTANTLEEYSRLLSIRAAVSVDTIVRTAFDNEATSTAITLTGGTTFQRKDLSVIRTKLQAGDVQPMDDGNFMVLMHPNITYDLQNDPSAGSLLDIAKYTDPSYARLGKMEDRGYITTSMGCKVYESTNVSSPSAGVYRVYGFGQGCAGVVDLADLGPSDIEDPKTQKFRINAFRGQGPQPWDPTGVLGGGVSYKTYFAVSILEGPLGIGGTYRFRTADPTTTIT